MHIFGPAQSNVDEGADLVVNQISFGLAYVREARDAYSAGNFDYAEVARKIAVNSYAAAIRFAANLRNEPEPALLSRIEQFESELAGLLQPFDAGLRSIA